MSAIDGPLFEWLIKNVDWSKTEVQEQVELTIFRDTILLSFGSYHVTGDVYEK